MGDDQTKTISNTIATNFTHLDQVDSDFALALALQEQERAFSMITSSSSESESSGIESDDSSDDEDNHNFVEFVEGEVRAELEFLDTEDSNSDQEMEEDDIDLEEDDIDLEEDDIDPDELSYEELVALGDIVGEESRGLSANEISSSLHPCTCQSVGSKTLIDRCVICQVEYEEGELMVALPCDHPYHSDCISKWLQIKKICPICSTEVSSPKIAS